jgi:hypothetical protein
MSPLVVGWDSHVDVLRRRISVTQCNNRNVDIAGFLNGLGVSTRIGDHDQARFFEGSGDVVGKVSRRKAAGNGSGPSMSSKFKDGTLTIRASGDHTDISRIVDSGNDSGRKDNFLPNILCR